MIDFIAKWRLWIGAALLLFAWTSPQLSSGTTLAMMLFVGAVVIAASITSDPFEPRRLSNASVIDRLLHYAATATFVVAVIYHYGFDGDANLMPVLILINTIFMLPYPRVDSSDVEEA